jgi:hypothetical protein
MRKPRPAEYALTAAEVRFDLAAWLLRHAVVVHSAGQEWICACPACGRPKLQVNISRKASHCWVCAFATWRPVVLVAALANVTTAEATEIVAAHGAGMELGPVDALAIGTRAYKPALPEAPFPSVSWTLTGTVLEYARTRGISDDHARMFGIGMGAGLTSTKIDWMTRGRLVFPVWAPDGRLVYWTARATDASTPKVFNLPTACDKAGHPPLCACEHERWGLRSTPGCAGKEDVLLGIHLLRAGDPVVLVEGPMDAAVCGPGFVSVGGAALSMRQAVLLAGTGASEAIVLFDGDDAGRAGTWGRGRGDGGAVAMLAAFMPTRAARCPEGTDPAQLGRERAMELALSAPPMGDGGDLVDRSGRVERIKGEPPYIGPLKET